MRPPIYDWHTIEQDFIHNNVPLHNGVKLKTIAKKYRIPYQTVRRKAATDKWHSRRYWCYLSKVDPVFIRYYAKLEKEIERLERRIAIQSLKTSGTNTVKVRNGRDPKTGRFLPGNQAAVGNRGNRNPKWRNQNAVKHGLYSGGNLIQLLQEAQSLSNIEI